MSAFDPLRTRALPGRVVPIPSAVMICLLARPSRLHPTTWPFWNTRLRPPPQLVLSTGRRRGPRSPLRLRRYVDLRSVKGKLPSRAVRQQGPAETVRINRNVAKWRQHRGVRHGPLQAGQRSPPSLFGDCPHVPTAGGSGLESLASELHPAAGKSRPDRRCDIFVG
jgi:hypothetical protein